MKILITGHKGFVGRHFVNRLSNHNVLGVDIKDGYDCRDYFKSSNVQFDLAIHLAAVVGGREDIDGRPLAVADNFSIDSEFFQWCLKTKPKKIVYFSSSAAYPTWMQSDLYPDKRLIEDDIDLNFFDGAPDMTYGWSKLTGEYLSSFVDNVYIFRPFSGYGPDQDLNYPFPMFIKRAVEKQDPFEVWGNGKQTRDFIHIKDIVDAVLTAIENPANGPVNLGTGRATSFIELAEMSMDAVGYKGKIITRLDKPVGCMHRVSDNSKMLSFYTPKITLEQGIWEAMNG